MHHLYRHHYPFTAIVGQERLRLALILNAINPRIGGVLIRGQKGTAKSTAARGLAEVLPEIEVVAGCPYRCHPTDIRLMCDRCAERFEAGEKLPAERRRVPFVTLPLGATEDRVVGSIDVGAALGSGRVDLKPGLLAEANRGILYVDEINLLDDHLVDTLLDAAAMGRNIVERDGLSAVHPARFVLVGTMNPEEGDLRPQLLDRFGISVDVEGLADIEERVEILARLSEFDRDPEAFAKRFARSQSELRARIEKAAARLDRVRVDRAVLEGAARRALAAGVDGHRADATMVKAAVALCAWHGEESVTEAHLDEAASLVLPHRMRRRPFERPLQPEPLRLDAAAPPQGQRSESTEDVDASSQPTPTQQPPVAAPDAVTLPEPRAEGHRQGTGGPGAARSRGKRLGTQPVREQTEPVDVAATLLSAAVRQGPARRHPVPDISEQDLRTARVSARARRAICFVVDVSGSMAARGRLEAARDAARTLLQQSYQGRHLVSLVLAGGPEAQIAVELTRDAELVERVVAACRPSGKTPLAHALMLAEQELSRAKTKGMSSTLVVLTDGRANVPLAPGGDAFEDSLAVAAKFAEAGFDALVVDTENDFVNLGLGRELAERMGASYMQCETPDAGTIVEWVQAQR